MLILSKEMKEKVVKTIKKMEEQDSSFMDVLGVDGFFVKKEKDEDFLLVAKEKYKDVTYYIYQKDFF